nr:hypothetical protein [Tanacetum cinerariifolium]
MTLCFPELFPLGPDVYCLDIPANQLDHHLFGTLEPLDQYLVGKCQIVDKLMEHIQLEELMMTDCKNDMVIHTEKTRMMILVVEIEYVGMIADVVDKGMIRCGEDAGYFNGEDDE